MKERLLPEKLKELRKAFQTVLLNEMEKRIGPSFKKTKALIYRKDKNG